MGSGLWNLAVALTVPSFPLYAPTTLLPPGVTSPSQELYASCTDCRYDGGALGRVPVETRLAPKSESWQLSPHWRGVGDLCASSRRRFCTSPGRPRHALTTRLGFVHGEGASPCTNPAGVRWACRLRPGEVQNTRCATTAEVKISHWGPSHVEMTSPRVHSAHTSQHTG